MGNCSDDTPAFYWVVFQYFSIVLGPTVRSILAKE